jgi:hypothetical protein
MSRSPQIATTEIDTVTSSSSSSLLSNEKNIARNYIAKAHDESNSDEALFELNATAVPLSCLDSKEL